MSLLSKTAPVEEPARKLFPDILVRLEGGPYPTAATFLRNLNEARSKLNQIEVIHLGIMTFMAHQGLIDEPMVQMVEYLNGELDDILARLKDAPK